LWQQYGHNFSIMSFETLYRVDPRGKSFKQGNHASFSDMRSVSRRK
jgi:hypothetical protein